MLPILILAFGLGAWLLQVRLAKQDHFFGVNEMLQYHGVGLPMVWHLGIMWSDPFVLTPLLATLGWLDNRNWSLKWDGIIAALTFLLSVGMHLQYKTDVNNNPWRDNVQLMAVHMLFMWAAFFLLGHSYLRAPHTSATLLVVISVALFVHVVVGTHLVVKCLAPVWFTPNQPLADTVTLVVWFGAAALLAGRFVVSSFATFLGVSCN